MSWYTPGPVLRVCEKTSGDHSVANASLNPLPISGIPKTKFRCLKVFTDLLFLVFIQHFCQISWEAQVLTFLSIKEANCRTLLDLHNCLTRHCLTSDEGNKLEGTVVLFHYAPLSLGLRWGLGIGVKGKRSTVQNVPTTCLFQPFNQNMRFQ